MRQKQMKRAAIVVLLAIFTFTLGQLSYYSAAHSLAEGTGSEPVTMPSPSPTQEAIVIELQETPKQTCQLTPPPNFESIIASHTPLPAGTFDIKEFDMPRDIEVLWNKVLWFSPLKSEKGGNPNKEKIALLWVIINEYECSKVINSAGAVVEYSSLSIEDKNNNNFTWLFPKDFYELLMRPGDHDWFINSIKTNQPWHESSTNDKIVHLVYNVWMSEKEGLKSGRLVPQEYTYYAFTKDKSGSNRKLVMFKSKSDLVNFENPYTWYLTGKLDNE